MGLEPLVLVVTKKQKKWKKIIKVELLE